MKRVWKHGFMNELKVTNDIRWNSPCCLSYRYYPLSLIIKCLQDILSFQVSPSKVGVFGFKQGVVFSPGIQDIGERRKRRAGEGYESNETGNRINFSGIPQHELPAEHGKINST